MSRGASSAPGRVMSWPGASLAMGCSETGVKEAELVGLVPMAGVGELGWSV